MGTEPEDDFAALFEASIKARRYKEGQTIEGTIVGIGPDVAFVDVGGKGEATIEVEELKDEDGDIDVDVGERIQAVVVSVTGGLRLSRKLARGAATNKQLKEAFRSGLPIEGKVEKEIKGGYDVSVARQRAFCPYSQMDIHRSEPATHIGRVYTFRIAEYKENGRSIVLSRRALLEEQQRAEAAEVRKSIVPGAVLTGRVASVREFGAFIDLGGGVQGLLHISEMGWSRVSDPSHMMKPGEDITVKVLQVDEAKQKISLGLKQLVADPWTKVPHTYAVGQVRNARVTRHTPFGAFVELEPGVEALAHESTFAATGRKEGWTAQVPVGTTLPFEILTIDPEKKRIGVALVPEGSSRARAAAGEDADMPTGDSTPGFGSLGDRLRDALKPRS
jgi:small subunit ribosomal protein S1